MLENQTYQIGDVVEVGIAKYYGFIKHQGIVTCVDWMGRVWVISNSMKNGHAVEEPLDQFAEGQKVKVVGYLGNLQPHEVVARARSQKEKPWNLLTWNCEHFVRYAHKVPEISPQLVAGGLVAGLAVGSLFLLSRGRLVA